MQEMTNKNLRSNADLALRVEELQEQIEALHASLEITTTRLEAISQELAAGRVQSGAGVVLPPVTVAPGSEPAGTGTSTGAAMPAGSTSISGGAASPDELYR